MDSDADEDADEETYDADDEKDVADEDATHVCRVMCCVAIATTIGCHVIAYAPPRDAVLPVSISTRARHKSRLEYWASPPTTHDAI